VSSPLTASLSGAVPNRIEVAVFVSGVVSMGLEIAAGRQLSPSFGSSIFTWGSIIGVFLTALAVGYWIAGKRARNHASTNALALVFVGATVYVAILLFAGTPFLRWVDSLRLPPRVAPILPITVLFGPPTALLGFVSPYAAELVEAKSTGDASGRVYALGTAGSIIGAFGTTFLLVPEIGVVDTEFALALLMLVTAMVIVPPEARATRASVWIAGLVLGIGFIIAGLGGGAVVYETQTPYQQLEVIDDSGVRTMYLDGVPHSAMNLDEPTKHVFEYTSYFHLAMLATEDVDRVLFVGGGGFSGPKRFLAEYNVTVDVVEIDPGVITAARSYFRVRESEDLQIHRMDGREYLQRTNHTYDVVVLDAYQADRVPQHLTTVEFMSLVSHRMDSDGVVVANVVSARDGPESAYYRAQYRTMDRVFPQVYSFPTSATDGRQNIELVATKDANRLSEGDFRVRNQQRDIGIDLSSEIARYTGDVEVGDAPLLRDGHAPVDSLLARGIDMRYVIERSDGNQTTVGP
jgi:spermidine synthase